MNMAVDKATLGRSKKIRPTTRPSIDIDDEEDAAVATAYLKLEEIARAHTVQREEQQAANETHTKPADIHDHAERAARIQELLRKIFDDVSHSSIRNEAPEKQARNDLHVLTVAAVFPDVVARDKEVVLRNEKSQIVVIPEKISFYSLNTGSDQPEQGSDFSQESAYAMAVIASRNSRMLEKGIRLNGTEEQKKLLRAAIERVNAELPAGQKLVIRGDEKPAIEAAPVSQEFAKSRQPVPAPAPEKKAEPVAAPVEPKAKATEQEPAASAPTVQKGDSMVPQIPLKEAKERAAANDAEPDGNDQNNTAGVQEIQSPVTVNNKNSFRNGLSAAIGRLRSAGAATSAFLSAAGNKITSLPRVSLPKRAEKPAAAEESFDPSRRRFMFASAAKPQANSVITDTPAEVQQSAEAPQAEQPQNNEGETPAPDAQKPSGKSAATSLSRRALILGGAAVVGATALPNESEAKTLIDILFPKDPDFEARRKERRKKLGLDKDQPQSEKPKQSKNKKSDDKPKRETKPKKKETAKERKAREAAERARLKEEKKRDALKQKQEEKERAAKAKAQAREDKKQKKIEAKEQAKAERQQAKKTKITFVNPHTGERMTASLADLRSCCGDFNRIARDWRRNESINIDPKLIDRIGKVCTILQAQGKKANVIYIHCGYRSPATNNSLIQASKKRNGGKSGVAQNSYHLKGKAVDWSIQGVSMAALYNAACQASGKSGGVRRYTGDGFVHMDTRSGMHRAIVS